VLQRSLAARERDALRERSDRQAQEFNALYSIGKTITSLRDIEDILAQVVSAAVNLTHADEGSLLLLVPDTGELYLRANKNLDETAAHNLRIKVDDTLMGRVIQSGRPVMLGSDDLIKVKTSFLVKAILNVPLLVADRVIGVLSVYTKRTNRVFTEHDVHLLSTLADYAAIALENAHLYWAAENERVKLQTILRDTQDAVVVTDADARVVLMNDAAQTAFGVQTDPAGAPLAAIIQNPAMLDLFDQRRQNRRNWRAEVPLADGRTLLGQLSELDGVGFGVVLQDISRLKELDRIKSEFISIVSHDLRTPLTTIRGYIDLLPRVGPLNPQQMDFLERIERSTDNIISLIADLLDVGRIEAGLDWEMEPAALHEIVREAALSLKPVIIAKKQTLTLRTPALPNILGNARRLEQLIANLVGNAIKYTPEGGAIAVSLSEDHEFLVLQVKDNGIGIPAEHQPHIFEKFYRVESEATWKIVGTGLGLSIVKTIVERHQGRVWVESEPGTGSTFTVLLPKMIADTLPVQSSVPRVEQVAPTP
jgi:two-component system NtrC family sensor kinase